MSSIGGAGNDTKGAVDYHYQHNQAPPPHQHYGTFEAGVQQPSASAAAMGFPQPVPPPGVMGSPPPLNHPGAPSAPPAYYAHGYQAVPGYAIAEGRPVREPRLPCCGCGIGWFLFIIGFFLAAIPWYFGAFILLCSRIDHREKPGYVACTVAAILAAIAVIFGVSKGADDWDW